MPRRKRRDGDGPVVAAAARFRFPMATAAQRWGNPNACDGFAMLDHVATTLAMLDRVATLAMLDRVATTLAMLGRAAMCDSATILIINASQCILSYDTHYQCKPCLTVLRYSLSMQAMFDRATIQANASAL